MKYAALKFDSFYKIFKFYNLKIIIQAFQIKNKNNLGVDISSLQVKTW